MRTALAVGMLAIGALAAAWACNSAPAPASPAVLPAQTYVVSITGLDAEGLAAGETAALSANVTLPDGQRLTTVDGARWTTSDARVATVDAQGTLRAIAEGHAVITATVKNGTAQAPVDVVANVSGDWAMTVEGTTCLDERAEGCGRYGPRAVNVALTLTQHGRTLSGEWSHVDFISGYPPLTGTIGLDGSIDLSGNHCLLDDVNFGTLYVVRDWHMDRAASGTYGGYLTWEQDGGHYFLTCDGAPTSRLTEVLSVTDFRRVP
jgi:Bacterial Ig-like domain (group 2)